MRVATKTLEIKAHYPLAPCVAPSGLAFSSNGGGSLTIVKDEGGDRYRVVQNVPTEKGARTMALDEKTHAVFLSTAKLGPPPEPTAENPHPPSHPIAVPGTFKLLFVRPEGAR